jgi:uncharacterized RDD family membrane protein YckC
VTAPAGAVSRLAAHAVDSVLVSITYAAGTAAVVLLARVVAGVHLEADGDRDLAGAALVAWWFAYFALGWATTGTTPGMALLGLRVTRADGSAMGAGAAVVRSLTFPLSVAPAGLGFVGIVLHPRRQALHDLLARTVVVYDDP